MSVRKRARNQLAYVERKDDSGDESYSSLTIHKKKVRWESDVEAVEQATEYSESEDDSNTLEKIYLTTWCKHGRVGCAYYDSVKCVIYVLEDTEESRHFDLIDMLILQVNPQVILTSSKSDDDFIDKIRQRMDISGGLFQIRPHKDFTPSKGRDRLLSLRLFSSLLSPDWGAPALPDASSNTPNRKNAYDFNTCPSDANGDPTTKRWNALMRLSNFTSVENSPLCIASIGALLDHILRERVIHDLDENEDIGSLNVRDIEILSLDQVMHINADALFSLQIFENESHASVHSEKTKEGLSLFGTLNSTKTSIGKSLLHTWFLRPSLSIPTINARHDAVACFVAAENLGSAQVMRIHLKGINNVPRILGDLRTGRAKISDWQGLVKFSFHSIMLRETIGELHQSTGVDITKKLISTFDVASFTKIGSKINETIDWEESSNVGRVCVRPGIDEELDNRKHVYHGIDSVLSKVAEQICETVSYDFALSLNVVYFPQLGSGFLICVPMLERWQTEQGIQAIEGWFFQFSSDAYAYFKSQEMHDMDEHIGDLHSSIVDREIEIIQELLEEILIYDKSINNACDVCAELDCLLSFAEASRARDYQRPQMVEDNVINIVQGRHPLQEQVVDTFVPNNAYLVGGLGVDTSSMKSEGNRKLNSLLLCTGANACGKSVYLKQIALIQYMAQIGCFIPAKSATLGIVDKSIPHVLLINVPFAVVLIRIFPQVFTRISTRESVSKAQSAFMIDLNQVSLALRNSTARSLILLDEFGKGTLSTDGAGLFCGVLKELIDRGSECPKVLAATHFHDVFRKDLLDPDTVSISFRHMQVMFTPGDGTLLAGNRSLNFFKLESEGTQPNEHSIRTREKMTYLYRVAEGLSLESHAAKCAEIFGVPPRIVQRAQYVSRLISTHELGRLLDEEMSEQERFDLEHAETVCRRFLAWDLDAPDQGGTVKENLKHCLGRTIVEGDIESTG
ncbi:DNA mismatch repair protein MutS [Collybia nuda]|uniref:DNA mismatch repair protein MutS n=1 Tax=Collybia nuda TaxID=64659 RepID=A0A9P5YJ10_9AGAR|nr:DNA mismatch repair protein MutS [Collybia nuda]